MKLTTTSVLIVILSDQIDETLLSTSNEVTEPKVIQRTNASVPNVVNHSPLGLISTNISGYLMVRGKNINVIYAHIDVTTKQGYKSTSTPFTQESKISNATNVHLQRVGGASS